jgi:hypothetical protein
MSSGCKTHIQRKSKLHCTVLDAIIWTQQRTLCHNTGQSKLDGHGHTKSRIPVQRMSQNPSLSSKSLAIRLVLQVSVSNRGHNFHIYGSTALAFQGDARNSHKRIYPNYPRSFSQPTSCKKQRRSTSKALRLNCSKFLNPGTRGTRIKTRIIYSGQAALTGATIATTYTVEQIIGIKTAFPAC